MGILHLCKFCLHFGSKFSFKNFPSPVSTLILNIPQICVDKDIFVGRSSSSKILFSLERSLSFVRITKSCARHHLTSPIVSWCEKKEVCVVYLTPETTTRTTTRGHQSINLDQHKVHELCMKILKRETGNWEKKNIDFYFKF